MIYHRPVDSNTDEVLGSGISQRVGTLLYVLVEGDINEEAYISNFDWPKFLENGPVPFALVIDNQSDIHIRTSPMIKIYNLFGKEVESLLLEEKNIFPMTSRDFIGQWDRVWGIGPYKAVVEASYGTQGQILTAESIVWLFPIKLVLLAVIVLLLLLILIVSLSKKKNQAGMETVETEIKQTGMMNENNSTENPTDLPKKE
jgi:hypothetical protein